MSEKELRYGVSFTGPFSLSYLNLRAVSPRGEGR